jgi:hypothetical protein
MTWSFAGPDGQGLEAAAGLAGLGVALPELAVAVLEGFLDGDDAGVEVGVLPAQAGQLAGAQAQDQAEDPQGVETVVLAASRTSWTWILTTTAALLSP